MVAQRWIKAFLCPTSWRPRAVGRRSPLLTRPRGTRPPPKQGSHGRRRQRRKENAEGQDGHARDRGDDASRRHYQQPLRRRAVLRQPRLHEALRRRGDRPRRLARRRSWKKLGKEPTALWLESLGARYKHLPRWLDEAAKQEKLPASRWCRCSSSTICPNRDCSAKSIRG